MAKNKSKNNKSLPPEQDGWKEDFLNWFMIPGLMKRMTLTQIQGLGLEQIHEDIPKRLKNIQTQKEFSKKYKISEKTLIQEKKKDYFIKEIHKRAKTMFKLGGTLNVYLGLYRAAVKGNPTAAKIYMQIIENWMEKIKVGGEIEQKITTDPILKKAVKFYEEELKKQYRGGDDRRKHAGVDKKRKHKKRKRRTD